MRLQMPDCEHCKNRHSSLFHFCHLDEISELDKHKTCTQYKKGQLLFQEGTRPLGLFCVNSGKVKVFKDAPDAREQIIRIATPGDFVGYSSLLSEHAYPVSAAALEDSTICIIPRTQIMNIFNHNSRFSREYVKILTETINRSYERLATMAYKPVRGRMAEALLLLYNAYKSDQNPNGIITITREDLASLVGTVKETVIRTLKEFKQDRLISTHRSDITVNNPKGLIQVSALYD